MAGFRRTVLTQGEQARRKQAASTAFGIVLDVGPDSPSARPKTSDGSAPAALTLRQRLQSVLNTDPLLVPLPWSVEDGPPADAPELRLYVDDSGARCPNKKDRVGGHELFAMGGILVMDQDTETVKKAHQGFCAKWRGVAWEAGEPYTRKAEKRILRDGKGDPPLHSTDIRGRHDDFHPLDDLRRDHPERFAEFMAEYDALLTDLPVLGIACVIDKPMHRGIYHQRFGPNLWELSRTALAIVIERSAKIAALLGCRLRVFIEKTGPLAGDPLPKNSKARKGGGDKVLKDSTENAEAKATYALLRSGKTPFDPSTSKPYRDRFSPLIPKVLHDAPSFQGKESRVLQLADLMLFPICIGAYKPAHPTHQRLLGRRGYADHHLHKSLVRTLGIKYSCLDEPDFKKRLASGRR